MKRGDRLMATFFILLTIFSILMFTYSHRPVEHREVLFIQNGNVIKRIPLSGDDLPRKRVIKIAGDSCYNIVTIFEGKVAVTEATCPGQDCVHRGWISENGESSVCLPNRFSIRITSDKKSHVPDGATY